MSFQIKDRKVQPILGNSFTGHETTRIGSNAFATAIATALRNDFAGNSAVKTIVRLTAANERAVKNWYEARNAPSGEFLVLLCRHSDEVLETFLTMAGRQNLMTAKKLVDAKHKLQEILAIIDELESR